MKSYWGIILGFLINCGVILLCNSLLVDIEKESRLWWQTVFFFFAVSVAIITYLNVFAPKGDSGKQISYSIGASMAYSIFSGFYIIYCLYLPTNLIKATIFFLLGSFALQKIALVLSILRIK